MTSKTRSFDAFRLARERGVLEGTLDASAAPRLVDRIADDAAAEGEIRWRIAGTRDTAGRAALVITITGAVPVTCQRCLAPFSFGIDRETVAVLARSDEEADALDAATDAEVLVADHVLAPTELVEDEVLLTLPFAPMHEPGACVAGAGQE